MTSNREDTHRLSDPAGAWVDLGLTLPIFLVYHVAVVFLDVKNATDIVTEVLLRWSGGDRATYVAATGALGIFFVGVFGLLGRGEVFRAYKFVQIAIEGMVYSLLMRGFASYVVERVFAGRVEEQSRLVGFIMSMGAGFHEELAFRVVLFGFGAKVLSWLLARKASAGPGMHAAGVRAERSIQSIQSIVAITVWALVSAAVFSGVHYVGLFGDSFDLASFAFRWILGIILTLIFVTRGFAAAVWTHALYDVWVLVLR